jgi:hypothetical protein
LSAAINRPNSARLDLSGQRRAVGAAGRGIGSAIKSDAAAWRGEADHALSSAPIYDQDARSAQNDVIQAKAATDLHQTEAYMSNIRTANKRHKRAIVATIARNRVAAAAAIEAVEPVKAAV